MSDNYDEYAAVGRLINAGLRPLPLWIKIVIVVGCAVAIGLGR